MTGSKACAATSEPCTTTRRRRPRRRCTWPPCSTSERSAGQPNHQRPTVRPSTRRWPPWLGPPRTCWTRWSPRLRQGTAASMPRKPGNVTLSVSDESSSSALWVVVEPSTCPRRTRLWCLVAGGDEGRGPDIRRLSHPREPLGLANPRPGRQPVAFLILQSRGRRRIPEFHLRAEFHPEPGQGGRDIPAP